MNSELFTWLSNSFNIDKLDINNVSEFINYDLSLVKISPIYEYELLCILVYDIIENKKYMSIKLDRKHKFFLTAAKYQFDNIIKSLEISENLIDLWNKS